MNTFGQTYIAGSRAGVRIPLYDPKETRYDRRRFRRDALPALARANRYHCPTGREASRGWVLVARRDYNLLDKYSTTLQLEIGDPNAPGNVGVIKNLSIVQARCVTRGLASDPNALYLVELTDGRGILANAWFHFPTTAFYNIRAPAYPSVFHPGSMNAGIPWTWETMTRDLWVQMGSYLGAWPGLPYAPAGTPEGHWMVGKPAWAALCDLLAHLGMVVACDPTQAAPYTIVNDGADDPALATLQARYRGNLLDDAEWIDTGAGRVPGSVRVLFRRRNEVYGSEETVRYDSLQWDMTPYYGVTIAAPALFAAAVGTHFIWSDFTVRYDQDGVPLPVDVTTALAIAQERVTQYFNRIYSGTNGVMSQTYAGALPFATGAQVDSVCWYQDYASEERQGWKTCITRGVIDGYSSREGRGARE